MRTRKHRIDECAGCHRERQMHGRNLCSACYFRLRRNGTIHDFERNTYTRAELIAEWDLLRLEGYTRAQAAERLGITKARLEKAIEREQRAGVAA